LRVAFFEVAFLAVAFFEVALAVAFLAVVFLAVEVFFFVDLDAAMPGNLAEGRGIPLR
jgi:hypothetical protein